MGKGEALPSFIIALSSFIFRAIGATNPSFHSISKTRSTYSLKQNAVSTVAQSL